MSFVRSRIIRAVFRPAYIPALIAFLVMTFGGLIAEQQYTTVFVQNQRSEVAARVAEVRARLEGNINANIQLVRGLVATVATEPDIDQARFSAVVNNIMQGKNQLRSIAAAPKLVISMVYPLKGNEAAIGLDYRKSEAQRAAALQVVRSGALVFAGPVDLVQGGQGFIGRFPVYLDDARGIKRFWGLISGVIDTNRLYADSGVWGDSQIQFAIRGQDASGATGGLFYGLPEILESDPVTAKITLPTGSWQISAIPKGGWELKPFDFWLLRGIRFIATLIVVIPILFAAWLYHERTKHVRELEQRERDLKRITQRFQHALNVSKIGMWERQLPGGERIWDERMRDLIKLPHDAVITDQTFRDAMHPEDAQRVIDTFHNAVKHETTFGSDYRIVWPDGEIRYLRSSGTVHRDDAGNLSVLGINWDITSDVHLNEELKKARRQSELRNIKLEQAKKRIEHNSLHDALTGLPNRRYLDALLAGEVSAHPIDQGPLALMHLDLDRFKQINDTYGHAAGDLMLVHTAEVLRNAAQQSDFVARIGGDEFVIVCTQNADTKRLETIATQIVEKMREPVIHEGRSCRFGVSIGIECTKGKTDDAKQMLINADIALYSAKEDGRNGFKFFNPELHVAAINTKRLADEVLIGMEKGQFVAHYQPQFSAGTRQIVGVEALARWQHPERGLLTPDAFLDIAEDLNIMGEFDAHILDLSLQQMARWKRAGLIIPRVAVNVSARRLHDENLIPALEKLDIEPGTLVFELLESIYLDNHDDLVTANLQKIRELGIELEVDDFGTGHTSIISLMQLRPSRLKIDRQLILPIATSSAQCELVHSIVQIGASLGIEALAEGVETEQHARIVEDLGCTAMQGHAFARSMTGHQVTNFARKIAAREPQKQAGAA